MRLKSWAYARKLSKPLRRLVVRIAVAIEASTLNRIFSLSIFLQDDWLLPTPVQQEARLPSCHVDDLWIPDCTFMSPMAQMFKSFA